MKTNNGITGALRTEKVGLYWEEILTNSGGTFELNPFTTFRVRAAAAVTVTVNGKLAMTMASGEIERFNCGDPNPSTKKTVTVVIAGNAYVQTARELEFKRQAPNA